MTNCLSPKLIGMLSLCLFAADIRAGKGPTDVLADQADAVVVGNIQSGQQNVQSLAFMLSVARTIKGNLFPGDTIQVSGRGALSLNRSLAGQYGLWFLKKDADGWSLIPVFSGSKSLEGSSYLPLVQSMGPDSLGAVNAQALATSDRIAVELVAGIEGYRTPSQLSNLVWALAGINGSGLLPSLYSRLRSSSDPEIKFIGVFGELGGGNNVSALAEVANNLQQIKSLHARAFLGMAVCGNRDTNPEAIRHLGTIATSADSDWARCGAAALAAIHTRQALPYLAQLLDSSDQKARESAMWGFARFVKNLPVEVPTNIPGKLLVPQGPTPYRTSETDRHSPAARAPGSTDDTADVQFWKSWWASTRAALTP